MSRVRITVKDDHAPVPGKELLLGDTVVDENGSLSIVYRAGEEYSLVSLCGDFARIVHGEKYQLVEIEHVSVRKRGRWQTLKDFTNEC
ncbi:hypothetical protein [Rhodobacteraceae phage LS06-2018-MD06]|jgi:hypothetical protein|nr:hypothetical protein [Rhodobacteraceae phage LS06-2018-MD06]